MALVATLASTHASTSFADFDQRAKAGERLTVVFFGASLTWGANASDPANTSYRADVANYLDAAYPQAHFKYYDAAIGGTGSQLGVFRLDRDVLRRKPDLVFLDFSANDDIYSDAPESLASYESIVRRLVVEAKVPVVQVIFPFKWNTADGTTDKMKRRTAHLAIAAAYHTAVGDAITYTQQVVKDGKFTLDQIWPADGVHPGDVGYQLFADAAWQGYQAAVAAKVVCAAPEKMLYADTYLKPARVRITSICPADKLPAGWRLGRPNLTAAWHDGLMSRWIDDVVIASNRSKVKNAEGKMEEQPQAIAPLKARFTGSMVLLFGEGTTTSGKYRVLIDGKPVTHVPYGAKEPVDTFDPSTKKFGGNIQHVQVVTTGPDATVIHTLEIQPAFLDGEAQELCLESICVAGGDAKVLPAE